MPINDINRFIVYTQFNDQIGINVWNAQLQALVGVELTNVQRADAYFAQIAGAVTGLISAAATFRGTGVRRVLPAQTVEGFSTAAALPGTVAGEPMPRQTAGVITLRSPFAGRANRGRKYIPFPGEANNTTGIGPDAAYLANMNTYAAFHVPNLVITSGATTETWKVGNIFSANPPTITAFTSFLARTLWGTQRRRGSFGRPNVSPV